ncbi:MAG: hypothetical protein ACI9FJ_002611, partial [Alteromonadaceae bacterium]
MLLYDHTVYLTPSTAKRPVETVLKHSLVVTGNLVNNRRLRQNGVISKFWRPPWTTTNKRL